MSATGSAEERRRPLPRLHLVTSDEVLSRAGFPELAEAVLGAGGAEVALHLRGRSLAAGPLLTLARRLTGAARAAGAQLLVNDRVDVARAAGAHGVQLGSDSLPQTAAREMIGDTATLGVSVHSAAEAAAAAGADFLLAGHLWPTPSHPGQPGRGSAWLQALVRAAPRVPVVAIGGVTAERVPEALDAGAYGVAVVRAVWSAADPVAAVARLLEPLVSNPEGSRH